MKRSLALVCFLLIASCQSVKKTQRALNSGNYTEAMSRSINQLQKNKFSSKGRLYASILKQSFTKYRSATLDKIDFLERETLRDNSKAVYEHYMALQNIQNSIKPLLPLENSSGKILNFKFYDFSENILLGKKNYANYLYTKATDFLRTDNKIDSRLAYNSLVELEKLAPNFKNTSALKREAYIKGVDFILVSLFNDTNQVIPAQVEERLLNFSTFNMVDLWTEYHVTSRSNIAYDFAIEIHFNTISFSPERLVERQQPLVRDVVDGWEYRKDRRGAFILDENGNKIKDDILIEASGTLFETIQSKDVGVNAQVNYYDVNSDQKINSYPLESIFVFENRFANFEGNIKVLTEDELFLLKGARLEYPTHEKMMIDASEEIKIKLKEILKQQHSN